MPTYGRTVCAHEPRRYMRCAPHVYACHDMYSAARSAMRSEKQHIRVWRQRSAVSDAAGEIHHTSLLITVEATPVAHISRVQDSALFQMPITIAECSPATEPSLATLPVHTNDAHAAPPFPPSCATWSWGTGFICPPAWWVSPARPSRLWHNTTAFPHRH